MTVSAQFHERLALSVRFRRQLLTFKIAIRTGNKQQKRKEKEKNLMQSRLSDHSLVFIDSMMVLNHLYTHFVVSEKRNIQIALVGGNMPLNPHQLRQTVPLPVEIYGRLL